MKYLITGFEGFIGSVFLESLKKRFDIEGLNYSRFTQKSYPQLTQFSSIPLTIIHFGASSSRHSISKDLYRNNYHSLNELVDFCSASKDRKLIFFSANSVGFSQHQEFW